VPREQSDYALVGVQHQDGLRYAWHQTGRLWLGEDAIHDRPPRDGWIALNADDPGLVRDRLTTSAGLLARIDFLTRLPATSQPLFPFQLALRRDGAIVAPGHDIVPTKPEDPYELVLRRVRDAAPPKGYLYVLAMDACGAVDLVFPKAGDESPSISALGPRLDGAPLEKQWVVKDGAMGRERYFLFVSRDKVPNPETLKAPGVHERLLGSRDLRGGKFHVDGWEMQSLQFRSRDLQGRSRGCTAADMVRAGQR
jgi:hypothetical protein